MLRIDASVLDYAIIAIYFVVVLGIGFGAKRLLKTDLDFFLSGRSLPAWITGLAFIAANLGALEVLGMAANGAQYGVATVHFYWIGAIPAMIFLGLVMMPFYYGAKIRSAGGRARGGRRRWRSHRSRAAGPASTVIAPSGGPLPRPKSASTEPPNPPPMIRAPSAPARRQRSTVRSTSGTETS
jgi:hypothetical protein